MVRSMLTNVLLIDDAWRSTRALTVTMFLHTVRLWTDAYLNKADQNGASGFAAARKLCDGSERGDLWRRAGGADTKRATAIGLRRPAAGYHVCQEHAAGHLPRMFLQLDPEDPGAGTLLNVRAARHLRISA